MVGYLFVVFIHATKIEILTAIPRMPGYYCEPTVCERIMNVISSPYVIVPVATYYIGTAIIDLIATNPYDTRTDIDARRARTIGNSTKAIGVLCYTFTWPFSKWIMDGVDVVCKSKLTCSDTSCRNCQERVTVKKA